MSSLFLFLVSFSILIYNIGDCMINLANLAKGEILAISHHRSIDRLSSISFFANKYLKLTLIAIILFNKIFVIFIIVEQNMISLLFIFHLPRHRQQLDEQPFDVLSECCVVVSYFYGFGLVFKMHCNSFRHVLSIIYKWE